MTAPYISISSIERLHLGLESTLPESFLVLQNSNNQTILEPDALNSGRHHHFHYISKVLGDLILREARKHLFENYIDNFKLWNLKNLVLNKALQ